MSSIWVWLCFLAVHQVYTVFQRLFWRFSGLQKRLASNRQKYETSAQVFNIHFRCLNKLHRVPSRRQFIASHSHFEHPDCVLADNVSLYTVTADGEAIFVRTLPGIDVFNSRVSPLVLHAQFASAKQMIIMSLVHFNRIADTVGDPKSPVVALECLGRCGSTLLAQMMEKIPTAVAISSPHAFYNIKDMMLNKILQNSDAKQLVKSSIRVLCKPRKVKPILYLMKFNSGTTLYEYVSAAVPDIRLMFMYRANVINNLTSQMKMYFHCNEFVHQLKRSKTVEVLCPKLGKRVCDYLERKSQMYFWVSEEEKAKYNLPLDELLLLKIHRLCEEYMRWQSVLSIAAIRYEDVVENTDSACKAIARHCRLPNSFCERGPSALNADSQAGSFVSKKEFGRFVIRVTEKDMDRYQQFCARFGIPAVDKDWCLPGTITCK